MTLLLAIVLTLLVASLCVACYILGRIDATLNHLKHHLPPIPPKERGTK